MINKNTIQKIKDGMKGRITQAAQASGGSFSARKIRYALEVSEDQQVIEYCIEFLNDLQASAKRLERKAQRILTDN